MFAEINSDYLHKYDVLRTLVFELIHYAMKMQPNADFTGNLYMLPKEFPPCFWSYWNGSSRLMIITKV